MAVKGGITTYLTFIYNTFSNLKTNLQHLAALDPRITTKLKIRQSNKDAPVIVSDIINSTPSEGTSPKSKVSFYDITRMMPEFSKVVGLSKRGSEILQNITPNMMVAKRFLKYIR
jgi:hypothetical protein